ncbi:hypothetical protein AB0F91_00100 [Amycolatopsis sp. NPDC023774]|uniref:hypothetical protein n=1 Tax=Amycolatopsis sp. NPDC023774 TaxID=3155015 RepID=UPI0033DBAB46
MSACARSPCACVAHADPVTATSSTSLSTGGQAQADPDKVAGAIHDLSTQENPPVRIPLGSDAFDALSATLQARLDALWPLEKLACSVAIDRAPEEG